MTQADLSSANPCPENTPAANRVLQEAADWHVLMHSGEATEADQQGFNQWREQAQNAAAYAELDAVWARFDAATPASAKQALRHVLVTKPAPSKTKKIAGAACGLLLLLLSVAITLQLQRPESSGAALARYFSPAYLFSDYKTGVGEQRSLVLEDQTHVLLNTFTAIEVEYTAGLREIHLLQGEIQLDVASDPQRPLKVVSQHGSATALGTRYSVFDRGDAMEVTVTESRVDVCNPIGAGCRQVSAGQKIRVEDGEVQPPTPSDADFEYDWQTQQLIVANQPLLKVLDELSRYQIVTMRMDRSALADYHVSGVFSLAHPHSALVMLEHSLPIEIARYTPLLTVVREKTAHTKTPQ